MMVRQEIVFAIMGGVFVVEAISVFLQIGSLRMRNKRVFLMAPLHHHYEKKGWRETQVVIRFWWDARLQRFLVKETQYRVIHGHQQDR